MAPPWGGGENSCPTSDQEAGSNYPPGVNSVLAGHGEHVHGGEAHGPAWGMKELEMKACSGKREQCVQRPGSNR